MMKKILFTLLLVCAATSVNASLVNTSVLVERNFPTLGSPIFSENLKVGSWTEFTVPERFTFDISDSAIEFTALKSFYFFENPPGNGNFNGMTFSKFKDSSGNPLSGFSGFSTDSNFTASNLTAGADFIRFDFAGIRFSEGQKIHIDLDFSPAKAVPEPASLALFSFGVFAISARRRKR
ncbi:MAG: PEP-CTERM sorting domain-containing protein [Pseudomonadota bacterium]